MAGQRMAFSRRLEIQLALAMVLHSMSLAALEGWTSMRTQAVVGYLHVLAQSPLVSDALRGTCATLSRQWRTTRLI